MTDRPKTQREKFEDAVREAGCDEDEARFEEALRHIAKTPPPGDRPPAKRPKEKRST